MAANKTRSNSNLKGLSPNGKKLVAAIVVIVVILLIAAILFISIRGLWGDIISEIKSALGLNDGGQGGEKPPAGTALLQGKVLEMRVLDIGQGDCILLLFPDGKIMVMDIGSEFGKTSPWNVLNGALTDLNVATIDYLFLTHTDYDHIREAKKLIDGYEIKNFYFPRADIETTATWKAAYNAAKAETYVEDGVVKAANYFENIGAFEISGDNWVMKCYSFDEKDYPKITANSSAENKNAVSPTCLLEYADKTIVLTGDSNEKSENYLLSKGYFDGVDADVLKVGHHGSKSSTCNEFLNKIDCEYAIISCGAGNEYGHPTPETLARLKNYVDLQPDGDYNGYAEVYRTDEDGTIRVQIDEMGVMNLIADGKESKNATTGTPIQVDGSKISQQGIVMFAVAKEEYIIDGVAA